MNFKQTELSHETAGKKKISPGIYQALDLSALIGGKIERELNLEEQVAASVKKERERIAEQENEIAESKKELLGLIELMKSSIDDFASKKEKYWQDVQKEMGEIVLLLVGRIVDTEVKTNAEVIEKSLSKLMDQYQQGDKVRLSLNAEDMQMLDSIDSKVMTEIKSGKGIELIVANDLSRGDARMDTSTLRMESGVSKRMEYVWNEMSAILPTPLKVKSEEAKVETVSEEIKAPEVTEEKGSDS